MQPSQLVFSGATVRVGLFRCRPCYPQFSDTGPIQEHLLVFPRTSVMITHAGKHPVVADPNVVMLYNQGQLYRRDKLSERGDLCEWFAFAPTVLADAIRPFDPRVDQHPERPFARMYGPSEASAYLLQRLVIEHCLAGTPDPLYVEETMLAVLGHVVEATYRASGSWSRHARAGAGAALADDVRVLIATTFREQLSLDRIARAVHSSPYHLCRVFRQETGLTIHAYLNQIRLRTALEQIGQGHSDLTELGIEMGYSSHSHFTQAFRRMFGTPPSHLRRTATSQGLSQLSKKLIAQPHKPTVS